VLRQSHMAWARDRDSYSGLKELLGDRFDPTRHRCGVDMAFGLCSLDAHHALDQTLKMWLDVRNEARPLVGFNVSGLIYNDPERARARYGFRADYRETVIGFLSALIERTTARVVLISHVMDQPGHYESDLEARRDVVNRLGKNATG